MLSSNFKQHRLLAENYNRARPLGLKNPHNLGIVSNRPDTAVKTEQEREDMEESMRLSMKHMHGGPHDDMDDDRAMLNRDADMDDEDMEDGDVGDEEGDDLDVGDDNDLDSAADSDELGDGEDLGDDDEEGDEEGDGDMDAEGDDEYPEDEEDELGRLEKTAPPMGRAHDSAAYMARHMKESKSMPPWLKGKEKGEKGEKSDKDGDKKDKKEKGFPKKGEKKAEKKDDDKGDKKNMKDGGDHKHKKGDKGACKKCSSGMNMKESFKDTKPVDRMDKKEFAKRIAEQYWQDQNKKNYFSGVFEEDMLLPNKEQEQAPSEPGPGDVGYAPQGRIGELNSKALAEAVHHLIKKVEKLERKINQMF